MVAAYDPHYFEKPTDLDLHSLPLSVNFYQQSGSSNLIGWKLEVGVAS